MLKYITTIMCICISPINAMFEYTITKKNHQINGTYDPIISINTKYGFTAIGDVLFTYTNDPDVKAALSHFTIDFEPTSTHYIIRIAAQPKDDFNRFVFKKPIKTDDSFMANACSSVLRATKILVDHNTKPIYIKNINNVSSEEADQLDFYNIMIDIANKTFPDPVPIELDPFGTNRKLTLNKIAYSPHFGSESSENPFIMIEKNSHDNEPITIVVRSIKPRDFIITTIRKKNKIDDWYEFQTINKYEHFWKSITPLRSEKRDKIGTFKPLFDEIQNIEKAKFIPITKQTNHDILTVYNSCIKAIQAVMADDADAQTLHAIEIPEPNVALSIEPTKQQTTILPASPQAKNPTGQQPSPTITEATSKPQASSYFTPLWQKLHNIRTSYLPFTATSWWNRRTAAAATLGIGSSIGAFYLYYNYMRNK